MVCIKEKSKPTCDAVVFIGHNDRVPIGMDTVPCIPYYVRSKKADDLRKIEKEMMLKATVRLMGYEGKEEYYNTYPGKIKPRYKFRVELHGHYDGYGGYRCLQNFRYYMLKTVDYKIRQFSVTLFPSMQNLKTYANGNIIDESISGYNPLWVLIDYSD